MSTELPKMGKALAAIVGVLCLVAGMLTFPLVFSGAPASATAAVCTTEGFPTDAVPQGWGKDVAEAAETAGIPASIIAAQLQAESGWNPDAASTAGAQGLAQFIPETWDTFGKGDPFDPEEAIAAQGRYMSHLAKELAPIAEETGIPVAELALAGYNAGPGAVQEYHGIPPFPQTQQYVVKIKRIAANEFGMPCTASADTTSGNTAGNGQDAGNAAASAGDTGDDYPFPDGAYCPLTGGGCMPGAANSQTGMYKRECVDWAIIELNADLGDTSAPYEWTNQSLLNGQGSALYWKSQWQAHGWTVSDTPAPDAIAWFAPGDAGAGAIGHVATVAAINDDGTVLIEEYNAQAPPNDHQYSTRTLPAGAVTKFLYLPTK